MVWPPFNSERGVHVPSLTELVGPDPAGSQHAYLGPVTNRRTASEWGLVLASQGVPYAIVFTTDGWVIQVPRERGNDAAEAVALYQDENRDWPPPEKRDTPRHRPTVAIAVAFALLWVFYAGFTGPAEHHGVWFAQGRADSRLLLSEPWRMVTALTLHGDSQHVIGNVISGTIFGTAVSRRIGPGGALFAMASAGALGNAANALAHWRAPHLSIGASTMVFASIGILAGFQTVLLFARRREPRRRKLRAIDLVGPLAGGLALLGSLGSGGENTDLGAHGFGFGVGVAVGVAIAAVMQTRGESQRPSNRLQVALGAATGLLVVGAWALALRV